MSEQQQESLADVIDNALNDLAGGKTTEVEAADDTATAADAADAGADAAAADAGEVEGGEGTPEAEGDEGAAGEGRERDPTTGKFVAKKPADGEGDKSQQPKIGADGKPIVEPAKDAAKKPDPLNDPLPKDTKAETKQRFDQLREITKTTIAERDSIKQELDYIVEGVQATGATAEQYAETLSWLSLFNSGDPKQQEKALELVEQVADRLATQLGKQRTLNDPLKDHVDLQQAVQTGKINREYAVQLATVRNRDKLQTQAREHVQTQAQTAEQQKAAHEAAKSELNTIEAELSAKDPLYAAKRDAIVPVLQETFKHTPYAQWGAVFRAAYAKVKVAAPAAAPKPAVPKNQPLRGNKSGGGSGTSTTTTGEGPKSMLDAINAVLP